MENGLKNIFWGLIFIFLDINIPFDMVPDFIGYILIFNGINKILRYEEAPITVTNAFKNGLIPSKIMIGVSIVYWYFDGVFENYNILYTSYNWDKNMFYLAATNLLSIAQILVIFYICSGMNKIGKLKESSYIEESSLKTGYIFLVVSLISLIIIPFVINTHEDLYSLIYIIGIILFVVQIYIILLVNTTIGLYKEKEETL